MHGYMRGEALQRVQDYNRMGISKYLNEIKEQFTLYGQHDDEWEPFKLNVLYKAFLAQRKKH
jgi:hypothetical protein